MTRVGETYTQVRVLPGALRYTSCFRRPDRLNSLSMAFFNLRLSWRDAG
jgi:hypothetical protein